MSGNIDFDSSWNYTNSNQGWFPNSFNWYAGNVKVGFIGIYDDIRRQIVLNVLDHNGVMKSVLSAGIDESNNIIVISNNKKLAMQQDVVPRIGGSVMTGNGLYRNVSNNFLLLGGGTNWNDGAVVQVFGANSINPGMVRLNVNNSRVTLQMEMLPSGTWTWNGTACQITSDQRLKQQITDIDDKLLDAWEDVDLVQFKYNDAVNEKGNAARLHTGYVVQQIDEACKSHNVDISDYGLYCHEEYPQETEEVEVTQDDGTTKKETRVIREASEHYSLRYTEVYAVECAYLRREVSRLKQQNENLEQRLKMLEQSVK